MHTSIKRTYKLWLGPALLALYAFVATPVQLWHHHTFATHHYIATDAQDTLSAGDDAVTEANCPVCSHQYSVYHDQSFPAIEVMPVVKTVPKPVYHVRVPAALVLGYSNKGPPASL